MKNNEIKLTKEELESRMKKGEKFQYVRTEKGGFTVVRKIK